MHITKKFPRLKWIILLCLMTYLGFRGGVRGAYTSQTPVLPPLPPGEREVLVPIACACVCNVQSHAHSRAAPLWSLLFGLRLCALWLGTRDCGIYDSSVPSVYSFDGGCVDPFQGGRVLTNCGMTVGLAFWRRHDFSIGVA